MHLTGIRNANASKVPTLGLLPSILRLPTCHRPSTPSPSSFLLERRRMRRRRTSSAACQHRCAQTESYDEISTDWAPMPICPTRGPGRASVRSVAALGAKTSLDPPAVVCRWSALIFDHGAAPQTLIQGHRSDQDLGPICTMTILPVSDNPAFPRSPRLFVCPVYQPCSPASRSGAMACLVLAPS